MAQFGKLFVLLNAVFSMVLLSWALALFATHVDPADAVDTSDPTKPKVTALVADLTKQVGDAQTGYATAMDVVGGAEKNYLTYTGLLAAKLDEADKNKFYDVWEGGAPKAGEQVDQTAIGQSGRLNLVDPKPVLGADNKPLLGVEVNKKNLIDAAARARASRATMAAHAKAHEELSDEVIARPTGYVARYDRFRRMFAELASEKDHLADERIGYDEQLASLDRRNRQLANRLKTLDGKPLGLIMPPADPTAATRR